MCRVIKKNEQIHKISDAHGEPKAKWVGSSSCNGDFTSTAMPYEAVIINEDTTFQTSQMCNGSTFSSPIASPYHTTPTVENESFSMGNNTSSLWVSPDLILDSSKVLKILTFLKVFTRKILWINFSKHFCLLILTGISTTRTRCIWILPPVRVSKHNDSMAAVQSVRDLT